MKDPALFGTIAAIITAFGVSMLFFRIQREIAMNEKNETIWIPYSDWLLITATIISLLLVIFPIIVFPDDSFFYLKLPRAASAASTIVVAGYTFGILAHYRLIFGKNRPALRDNPEPSEKIIVLTTAFLALSFFILLLST